MPTAQQDLTAKAIVTAFYRVYDTMGYGFLEKVYENALAVELESANLVVQQQCPINVYYRGVQVGVFFADLLVNDCVIIELKSVENLALEHEAQLINYLKASGMTLGLLINFGPNPRVKRKVYESARTLQQNEMA